MDDDKREFLKYMHETPEERKVRMEKDVSEGKIDARDMFFGHMHLEKGTGRYYESYEPKHRMQGTVTIYGLGDKKDQAGP